MTFMPAELATGIESGGNLKSHVRAAGLVLIRDIELDAQTFVELVERLGPTVSPWDSVRTVSADSRVQEMRVDPGSDRPERTSSAQHWHSDQSFAARPPEFTALYCVQAAQAGGGTRFCGTRVADPDRCSSVSGAPQGWIRHSFRESLSLMLRGRRQPDYLSMLEESYPDVWHPLIREQPETRAAALFLSPLTARTIQLGDDKTEPAANETFARLVATTTADANSYSHRWRAGDLLMWDNSVVMHRRDSGPVEGTRVHWRLLTEGAPVHAFHT